MCPQNERGRPIVGSEPKSEMIKIRIEPSLLTELKLTCRAAGITTAEAIRQGIIWFINSSHIRYY